MIEIHSSNAETCEDALKLWDSGETVWSVEMGGLGPGYEQAIQVLAFEILRVLIDNKVPTGPVENYHKDIRDKLVEPVISRLNKSYGFSGAQVGAAENIATVFYRQGYRKGLDAVEQERRILVSKGFPSFHEKEWLIWSIEHDMWWAPNHCGYTQHVGQAGRYSYEEALKITAGANWGSGPRVNENHRLQGRPYEAMVREDAYGRSHYTNPRDEITA